jgi:hypothetical protein
MRFLHREPVEDGRARTAAPQTDAAPRPLQGVIAHSTHQGRFEMGGREAYASYVAQPAHSPQ